MAGLVVKPRARILHGHDWVFSGEVLKVFGRPADGDVISLKDGKDHLIGSAIYNSKSQIVARRFSRRRQGKVRLAGPEVANFAANTDTAPNPYVQAKSGFKDSCSFRFAWIRPARHECALFREMSKTPSKAHPRRNCRGGK